MTGRDEVRMVVPAVPEFLRLARVAAVGLAGRVGFTFDQVEDLRLAVDELCFGLTGPRGRPGSRVVIRYRVDASSLEIEGHLEGGNGSRPPALSELSKVILAALVDDHDMRPSRSGGRFWARKSLTGNAAAADPD